jgi:phage tail P2-like protein
MSEFQSILPPNSTQTERALEQAFGAQKPDLAPVAQLMRPGLCPAPLLPWLAWALSVETWDHNWSEDAKREVLRKSIQVHRLKGTVQSVKAALKSAGYGDAELIERYGRNFHDGARVRDGSFNREKPDHWAEYRVRLKRPITIEQAAQVRAILKDTAPIRCHLKALEYPEALHLHNNDIVRDGTYTRGLA